MKKTLPFLAFFTLYPIGLWAQFQIKGKVSGYPLKEVVIKKWQGPTLDFFLKTKTNSKGKFKIQIPESYEGILVFELAQGEKFFQVLSDNQAIAFATEINKVNQVNYSKSRVNKELANFIRQEKNNYRLKKITRLNNLYEAKEPFYKALKSEMKRIAHFKKNIEPITSRLLKYHLDLEHFIEEVKKTIKKDTPLSLVKEHIKKITSYFKKNSYYLETSGKFLNLLMTYLDLVQFTYNSENEAGGKINQELDRFLSDLSYDSKIGQLVLLGFIKIFESYTMQENLDFFITKAREINPKLVSELSQRVKIHENLQIGKIAPDILFGDQPAYGKYKSLSQINSNYIILMFWSSWCKHCKVELPRINGYYEKMKNKGIEFIGISLDEEPKHVLNFLSSIKGIKWYNHLELKGLPNSAAKNYNITSTPTFYVLESRKVLFKTHKLEEALDKLSIINLQ